MNIPENLRYTDDHEWVRADEKGVYIGITDFAQGELGDIVYIDIDTVGQHLQKGQPFGTVEAVKTVSELFMPVSGKVIAINEAINNTPELVNTDPYGEGWMITIEPDNINDLETLLSPEAYSQHVGA